MSAGKWVEDGSEVCCFEGNEAKCNSDKKGSLHFNCLWDDGKGVPKGGEGHWEFEITEKGNHSVFVGFVEKKNFKKGWGMKVSLMFGGNLSSGGALQRSKWGPFPKTGDRVGAYAKFSDESVCICYSLNGTSLGCGFEVSSSSSFFPSSALFPVVSFGGGGQVVKLSAKEGRLSTERDSSGEDNGVCGKWILSKPVENHPPVASLPFPGVKNLFLTLEEATDGELMVSVQVANSMRGKAERVGEEGKKKGEGRWKGRPMMSTMMMPPPDLAGYEQFFSQLFRGEFVVSGEGDGLVVKEGGEGGGVTHWARAVAEGPVVLK